MKKAKAVKRDPLKHCAKNPGQERKKLEAHARKLERALKRVNKARDTLLTSLFDLSDVAYFAGECADQLENGAWGPCETVSEAAEIDNEAIQAFEQHLDHVWDYATDAAEALKGKG